MPVSPVKKIWAKDSAPLLARKLGHQVNRPCCSVLVCAAPCLHTGSDPTVLSATACTLVVESPEEMQLKLEMEK